MRGRIVSSIIGIAMITVGWAMVLCLFTPFNFISAASLTMMVEAWVGFIGMGFYLLFSKK